MHKTMHGYIKIMRHLLKYIDIDHFMYSGIRHSIFFKYIYMTSTTTLPSVMVYVKNMIWLDLYLKGFICSEFEPTG